MGTASCKTMLTLHSENDAMMYNPGRIGTAANAEIIKLIYIPVKGSW